MELSAVSSATEAVLFSDTSGLSWATSHEQGATESWDLLGLSPGSLGLLSCKAAAASFLSLHCCFEGPPARRTSASTKGPRASAALLWGLADQGASQQLVRWALNLSLLQGRWSPLCGHGTPSNMPASRLGGLTCLFFYQAPARHLGP